MAKKADTAVAEPAAAQTSDATSDTTSDTTSDATEATTEVKEEKQGEKSGAQSMTMESLLQELGGKVVPFIPGAVVEGTVISSSATRIWVDIQGVAVGVIPERELSVLSGELKPGDPVVASVLVLEDERGNIVLSLRRADRERISNELQQRAKDGQPMSVKISDANKGGLLIELGDFTGFLPVSQLASEHYPRVEGGNPDEIYARLKDLVGQSLQVKVINFDPSQGKLIFSEKAAGDALQEAKLLHIKEGDILEGTVTGIVDFGLFVKLGTEEDALEGLVHISEIAWGRVTDISAHYKVGDKVKVLVVSTADNRVSLSIKRLLEDPWQAAASKYKIGDIVKGLVTRVTPFGVFVRLDSDIDGLVHISEISNERISDPGTILHMGEQFDFKIISIDPDQHRLGLSYKRAQEPASEAKEEKPEKEKKTVRKKATRKKLSEVAVEEEPEEEV
ncbi:S1 RNA-binding domain-containing protein [Patescibacteria group bacterium]|nr:S1 RNA-binding domain-containing protein [Patescibacteria group bacterium]